MKVTTAAPWMMEKESDENEMQLPMRHVFYNWKRVLMRKWIVWWKIVSHYANRIGIRYDFSSTTQKSSSDRTNNRLCRFNCLSSTIYRWKAAIITTAQRQQLKAKPLLLLRSQANFYIVRFRKCSIRQWQRHQRGYDSINLNLNHICFTQNQAIILCHHNASRSPFFIQ